MCLHARARDHESVMAYFRVSGCFTPVFLACIETDEIFYRSTAGAYGARVLGLVLFADPTCCELLGYFVAPHTASFFYWHYARASRADAGSILAPAQVAVVVAAAAMLQVTAVSFSSAWRRRGSRRPAAVRRQPVADSDASQLTCTGTSYGSGSECSGDGARQAAPSSSTPFGAALVVSGVSLTALMFTPDAVFDRELYRPFLEVATNTASAGVRAFIMGVTCAVFGAQYFVMSRRREEAYTARGELQRKREARVATEVRYFLTFIYCPMVVLVSLEKVWLRDPGDAWAAWWWVMMAGRVVILAWSVICIRTMKREPTLYNVNIVGVVGIPLVTFYFLFLERSPALNHGTRPSNPGLAGDLGPGGDPRDGGATMRFTLLRAVVAFYIHSRTIYVDVFGVYRIVWSVLGLCWTTNWDAEKSAGVCGVAVFFSLTRVISTLLDRAEDVEGRARHAADLERLIDTANAPIFGIDTDGCVNEWNQRAAAIVGYPKEEALGKRLVEEFVAPDHRASVERVLKKALYGEETANYEFPLLSRGDSTTAVTVVLLNATTRRSAAGHIVGVLGVGQDITELRTVTTELAQVAGNLERLIDTANAPIFGTDVHGRVDTWNQCAASISGFAKEETLGRRVSEFIAPEYRASVERVIQRALHGTETANFEFPLSAKSGARVDVLLNATTRRSAAGVVVGVVGVGQDITELRAKEREAKDREIAHEAQLAETRAEARAQVERDATAYFFHEPVVILLQRTFCTVLLHSHGLDFYSRVLLCGVLTGSEGTSTW